jgi:hypothetical protein
MALPAMLGVHFGLSWLGRTNTTVGRKLRASDHEAWRVAVESKQRELDQLLAVEPRGENP